MRTKFKDETAEFPAALERTDRSCRLLLRQLRESYPAILDDPEFEKPVRLARRSIRENRELLGTGPT
jgi:hypothetical protein